MNFIATKKAQRPARMDGTCFYCGVKIGEAHKPDCVLVKKKVRVKMVVEYDVFVPAHWEKNDVEFHRNESSWCADNAIDELSEFNGCLCQYADFEYIKDIGEAFLDEN